MNSITSFCGRPVKVGTNDNRNVYVDPENIAGMFPTSDNGTGIVLKDVHIAGKGDSYNTEMPTVYVYESTDQVASKLSYFA